MLSDETSSDVDIGVIVSCAIGAGVCILVIVISIFLVIANRQQAKLDSQQQRILDDRMQRVWSVVVRYQAIALNLFTRRQQYVQ